MPEKREHTTRYSSPSRFVVDNGIDPSPDLVIPTEVVPAIGHLPLSPIGNCK
jgi:hypothetical protein